VPSTVIESADDPVAGVDVDDLPAWFGLPTDVAELALVGEDVALRGANG
jgi:hypothetical protein